MPADTLTFHEFLRQLRQSANNTVEQGAKFELAMAALLPQLPDYQFEEAWRWRDWPDRERLTGLNAQDNGIDIVARLRDSNHYWAIQCKFYAPDSTISATELGTFYAESGKQPFTGRLIITTTDKWTTTAEQSMERQQIETHRLRLDDLKSLSIDWNWVRPDKTSLSLQDKKSLRPHQEDALIAAKNHYETNERGQLIMACGTGKTYTSLKIAEEITPQGGMVLFIVPSLSLMKQSITEWAYERARDHRYIAVCSDDTVGSSGEKTGQVADISVPVSTSPHRIASHITHKTSSSMTVVFCTYQSLDRLATGQEIFKKPFDLVICDEAHRTTGVDRENRPLALGKNSNFVKIHEQSFIKACKRLYMTATPRIYTDASKAKAKEAHIDTYSMDNEAQYGTVFHRLSFGQAVEKGLLSDYRVIVLNIAEQGVATALSQLDPATISGLATSTADAAKIIGCYKALRDQGKSDKGIKLKRAVSFSSSIKHSKLVVEKFKAIVKNLNAHENDGFTVELDHVDGTQTALNRSKSLDWLRQAAEATEDGEVCRILSNARCLTEGVDVPSLDAILFMKPRKSQIDIVQAVGRVMRKAEGKDYGYVILPVVIPQGADINEALNSNETYGVVWEVLRALRAHDERFTNYASKLELNDKKPENISVIGMDIAGKGADETAVAYEAGIQLELAYSEEIANYVYAKIVDKVGDKRYLEQWAKDTANLHDLLVTRINEARQAHDEVTAVYDNFLISIKASINDGLTATDATSMLAQQLITKPIFDALFEGNQFSQNNVVSASLNDVLEILQSYGLEDELTKLEGFYESVKARVSDIDNEPARQTIITELYEKFFATAFPKTAESLGIAYTPIELVDFTLASADEVMRQEFGRGLSDEGVHVIDPFTGTGSFITRLLQNPKLIKDSDLHRKFTTELWANEILLLAYYIAAVNIEAAYHHRGARQYQAFEGISLTDSFELYEKEEMDFPVMMAGNSDRIKAQKAAPIRVVVGNPPWSAGQKSQNDDNANRVYPALDDSIRGSYAKRSSATNLNALYDSYIRAIRWASDRIGEEGVVAFVTNAGWLDGTSTDGMRICLEQEFDAIWVFNLRGNARTSGEQRQKESGNAFGQASRAPVVISLFVKNPAKRRSKAQIHYHDIGDYLKRDEKFKIIRQAGDITGLDWKDITPNTEGDWLNQRNPLFETFIELGNDEVKRGKSIAPQTIFHSFSSGLKSNRDTWVYNFSRDVVAGNMERMIAHYNDQLSKIAAFRQDNPKGNPETILDYDSTRISWSGTLKADALRNKQGKFEAANIIPSLYRPFTMEYLYFDRQFNEGIYRQPSYFPTPEAENRLICVTGKGASNFSCLIADTIPCLDMVEKGQTFPRWVYEPDAFSGELVKKDNVTDFALNLFRHKYQDDTITKDDIFDYVYGVLHAPDYREAFASNLRLSLPCIPLAKDFRAFADAGAKLSQLHLCWQKDEDEDEDEKVLPNIARLIQTEISSRSTSFSSSLLAFLGDRIDVSSKVQDSSIFKVQKMRWVKRPEGTFIKYNDHLPLIPIPKEALQYTIGNKTPLQWVIDRYQVKIDKASGIKNDPNDWIKEQGRPDALIKLIKRVTFLSIRTAEIVDGLPEAVETKSKSKAQIKTKKAEDRHNEADEASHNIRLFPLGGETKYKGLVVSQLLKIKDSYLTIEGQRLAIPKRSSLESKDQKHPNSLFIRVKFHLPHLGADIIEAGAFSQIVIVSLLPDFESQTFFYSPSEFVAGISDIAILCEDGSKTGWIQFIIRGMRTGGEFLTKTAKWLEELKGGDTKTDQDLSATNITVKQTGLSFNNTIIVNIHPHTNKVGGYTLPEAQTSKPIDYENALAMIGNNPDGESLKNRDKRSNADQTTLHYHRDNAFEPFKSVTNEDE